MRIRLRPLLQSIVLAVCVGLTVLADEPVADIRQRTFEEVWKTVKERHFDPLLNGLDWEEVRKRYALRVAVAKTDEEFYALLNEMLRELKQSHFLVSPPWLFADDEAAGRRARGEVGLTIQSVEEQATITRIEPDSSAARAGLRPGIVVTHIDETSTGDLFENIKAESERTVAARSRFVRVMRSRLRGPAGTSVRLRYLDQSNIPQAAILTRLEPDARFTGAPDVPTPPPAIESRQLEDDIGYIRFNLFVLPMLDEIRARVTSFRHTRGLVLDLRGNSGGDVPVTTAVAGLFFTEPTTLGTTRLRQGYLNRLVAPWRKPYTAPLVILVDEVTASAAESFTAALQEHGRAIVVGTPTVGGALPSSIARLPTGARLQFAIGEYRTPRGRVLEGHGVLPDVVIEHTRRDLLSGHDSMIDVALTLVRKLHKEPQKKAATRLQ